MSKGGRSVRKEAPSSTGQNENDSENTDSREGASSTEPMKRTICFYKFHGIILYAVRNTMFKYLKLCYKGGEQKYGEYITQNCKLDEDKDYCDGKKLIFTSAGISQLNNKSDAEDFDVSELYKLLIYTCKIDENAKTILNTLKTFRNELSHKPEKFHHMDQNELDKISNGLRMSLRQLFQDHRPALEDSVIKEALDDVEKDVKHHLQESFSSGLSKEQFTKTASDELKRKVKKYPPQDFVSPLICTKEEFEKEIYTLQFFRCLLNSNSKIKEMMEVLPLLSENANKNACSILNLILRYLRERNVRTCLGINDNHMTSRSTCSHTNKDLHTESCLQQFISNIQKCGALKLKLTIIPALRKVKLLSYIQNKLRKSLKKASLSTLTSRLCSDGSLSNAITLEGEVGVGKSAISRYIAESWVDQSHEILGLKEYDLCIPVECSKVATRDVIDFLKAFTPDVISLYGRDDARDFLKKLRVIWVIDSYDVATVDAMELLKNIMEQGESHLLFITTQPQQVVALKKNLNVGIAVKKNICSKVLLGLNKKGQHTMIEKHFQNEPMNDNHNSSIFLHSLGIEFSNNLSVPYKLKLMLEEWETGDRLGKTGLAKLFYLYDAFMERRHQYLEQKVTKLHPAAAKDLQQRLRDFTERVYEIAYEMTINSEFQQLNANHQENLMVLAQGFLIRSTDSLSFFFQPVFVPNANEVFIFYDYFHQHYLAAKWMCLCAGKLESPLEIMPDISNSCSSFDFENYFKLMLQIVPWFIKKGDENTQLISPLADRFAGAHKLYEISLSGLMKVLQYSAHSEAFVHSFLEHFANHDHSTEIERNTLKLYSECVKNSSVFTINWESPERTKVLDIIKLAPEKTYATALHLKDFSTFTFLLNDPHDDTEHPIMKQNFIVTIDNDFDSHSFSKIDTDKFRSTMDWSPPNNLDIFANILEKILNFEELHVHLLILHQSRKTKVRITFLVETQDELCQLLKNASEVLDKVNIPHNVDESVWKSTIDLMKNDISMYYADITSNVVMQVPSDTVSTVLGAVLTQGHVPISNLGHAQGMQTEGNPVTEDLPK